MQIYVCLKHVPDTVAMINIVGDAGFDESVKFVMNPYDEYAVEEALKIVKQEGGEVIAVTVGKEAAASTIRYAMAMGAHRGIHIQADAQWVDSMVTSQALKKVIHADGTPDLIFTGKQSVDGEGMQTHYRLAAALDMPAVNEVTTFSIQEGKAVAEREVGGGEREMLEISLPCVVGASKGLNEPRYPKMTEIIKSKKKKIDQFNLADLGLETPAASSELLKLEEMPERGQAKMIGGSPKEMAEELVQRLREDAKVL